MKSMAMTARFMMRAAVFARSDAATGLRFEKHGRQLLAGHHRRLTAGG